MTHEQGDLRVRRTRKLIQEAFIDLMIEKRFEAITVGDIAERAMVNRATFYRHYQDKYDLVDKIFQEAFTDFVSSLGPPREVPETVDAKDPPRRWVRFFEHFAEHARLYRAMLGSNGSPWFTTKMRDQMSALLLEREQRRGQLPTVKRESDQALLPTDVATLFTTNLFVSTLAWWLERGRDYSPEQMATWFLDFLMYGYLGVLGFDAPSSRER